MEKTNWSSLLAAVEHIHLRVKWVQLKTFHILGTPVLYFGFIIASRVGHEEEEEDERKKEEEMEGVEQQNKTRVVKVDSLESWDFYVNQATNQGTPVSFLINFTNFQTTIKLHKFFLLLSGSWK